MTLIIKKKKLKKKLKVNVLMDVFSYFVCIVLGEVIEDAVVLVAFVVLVMVVVLTKQRPFYK
jgi:hypothetical protein